ncbi:MAG TPA: TonB-dependent receptor [Steroidobacteraceae bacterium]|nr:TonB-dependent receptor [Steroidobacteraceae bacterium]
MKTSNAVRLAVLTALYGTAAWSADAVTDATATATASSSASTQDSADNLQEVTVTATRREASAQDLPMSITAVSGSQLESAGIADVAALAHSMAGVNFTDKGPFGDVNGSSLIIRGLNSEATAGQLALATSIVPPVATYVDDTPLYVNLRLDDLDHVEILRGPQGTLYGSGSLGGTIRFVQNAPDPDGFDAKFSAGVGDTQHTHTANADLSGMINIPLSSTLAVRANASYSSEAGFINQPDLYVLTNTGAPIALDPNNLLSPPQTASAEGTNSYTYRSAHISALWKPTDTFKAQLSYYNQVSTAGGFPYSSPLYGVNTYQSSDHTRGSTTDKVDVIALTLNDDLGFATLTSNSSWGRHENHSSDDLTDLYASFSFYPSLYGANPRVLVTGHDELVDKPWAEEIRLASKTGGAIDWVGGLFYRQETTDIQEHEFYPGYLDYFNACVPNYGVSIGDGVTPSQCGIGETVYTPGTPPTYVDGIPIVLDQTYIGDFETKFTDLAAFGEVTWHITSPWSITGGSRLFKQTVTQSQQTGLLFDGPISIANNTLSDTWRRALWKVNTSFQLNPTNLVYATWSQGFRRGGVNALPPNEPAVDYTTNPALYKVAPDTANNYEVGFKGTLESRIRYSADVFYIDWQNVQEGAQLTPLVLPGAINVGHAYSKGFETEVLTNITHHISGQLSYTYDATKLLSYAPDAIAGLSVAPPAPGGPLPGTPKSSVALTLEYGHVMLGQGELAYSLSARYQSSLIPALSATIPKVGGYTTLDTRLTWEIPHWTLAAYCNNLTNNLGISSWSDPADYASFYQAVVSTPRTVGVSAAYHFKDE